MFENVNAINAKLLENFVNVGMKHKGLKNSARDIFYIGCHLFQIFI